MSRIVYIFTHPLAARYLLHGQLAYMRERGFDVTLITAPGPDAELVREREQVELRCVPMSREIDLGTDLSALGRIVGELRELKPDIVYAGTPKAGLLGMLAARFLRVPVRVYAVCGLRLETTRGFKRAVLTTTERTTSACATRLFFVSESLRRSYLGLRLAAPKKTTVIGKGTLNGVMPARFAPTPEQTAQRNAYRAEAGIQDGDRVIGFVGRLTRDKGVVDLFEAFETIVADYPRARLLLIGDFERGDPVPPQIEQALRRHPRVSLAGFSEDVPPWLSLMELLVLPSYREGFPNVPLEAACAGLPVLGYASTGVVDAVVHGVTGHLVDTGDVAALASGMRMYLDDADLRRRHGRAGRERAERDFDAAHVWARYAEAFESLLELRESE